MASHAPRHGRAFAWLLAVLVTAGTGRPALAVNTGFDASGLPFVACNGRVGFRVSEAAQHATDLNGDGDATDFVLHVLDLGSGIVTNVGVDASGPLACAGNVFAFGVREAAEHNLDRNFDGDAFDTVLAVYDASTATLTNIGLAVNAIVASPSLIAFTVGESSQGGADMNGDGDVLDSVLHVLDPTTLAVTNLGLEAGDAAHIVVDGQRVAFFLSEDAQGHTDFNGDGDPLDTVALIYDAATATLINPHRAVAASLGIQLDSTAAAFVVSEAAQGNVSANGDLDAADAVMDLYCFSTPQCPVAGLIELGVDAGGGFTLDGDLLAFRTREKNQGGASLNPPDTDMRDTVVQYYRLSTGGPPKSTKLAGEARVRIVGDVLAFGVPERLQGKTLLNPDLDFRDVVLELFDTATETVTNTHMALWSRACRREATQAQPKGPCLATADDLVLFAAGEKEQNHTDLNGDGDAHDAVIHAWKVSTGTLTDTALAGEHKGALVGKGSLAAFRVSEADQRQDKNGDLDLNDLTMAVFDTTTGLTTELGQAADAPILIEGRTVVYRTSEANQNADLNGDGDKLDTVLQYQTFP